VGQVDHRHTDQAHEIKAIEIADELKTAFDLFSKVAAKLP